MKHLNALHTHTRVSTYSRWFDPFSGWSWEMLEVVKMHVNCPAVKDGNVNQEQSERVQTVLKSLIRCNNWAFLCRCRVTRWESVKFGMGEAGYTRACVRACVICQTYGNKMSLMVAIWINVSQSSSLHLRLHSPGSLSPPTPS